MGKPHQGLTVTGFLTTAPLTPVFWHGCRTQKATKSEMSFNPSISESALPTRLHYIEASPVHFHCPMQKPHVHLWEMISQPAVSLPSMDLKVSCSKTTCLFPTCKAPQARNCISFTEACLYWTRNLADFFFWGAQKSESCPTNVSSDNAQLCQNQSPLE